MEQLVYKKIKLQNQELNIFFHIHRAKSEKAFIFANPIFDEKKKSQYFQANLARKLNQLDYTIVRFDYYGTGESYGDYNVLNLENCVSTLHQICQLVTNSFDVKEISLLGIRLGANVLLEMIKEKIDFRNIFLIDPIISGKRYLKELSLRRKAFFQINNMPVEDKYVHINNIKYLDHQGFLISEELETQILNIDLVNEDFLSNKSLFLFSLDILNRKKMSQLSRKLGVKNKIGFVVNNAKPFWNSMETIETNNLQSTILEYV